MYSQVTPTQADETANRLEHLLRLGFNVSRVHARPSGDHVIVLHRPDLQSAGLRLIRTHDVTTIGRAVALLFQTAMGG